MSTTIHMTSNKELYPDVNNTGSLGTSTYKWANIYATTFNGALSGNASSATYATSAGSATSASNAGLLTSPDTRNATRTPADTPKGMTLNFKANSTIGLTADGGTYTGLLSWRSYGDNTDLSGGRPIEIAFSEAGHLWIRHGTSATAWSDWSAILDSTNYSSYITGVSGNYLPLSGGTLTGSLTMSGTNLTAIFNGKMIINPAYNTANNSFNEGLIINQASNGWAELVIGKANGNTYGSPGAGAWLVARRGASGALVGSVGDFNIGDINEGGYGLTLHQNAKGMTLYSTVATDGGSFNIISVHSYSSGYCWNINCRNPNMTAGANAVMLIGKAGSSYNQAYFGYHHSGDGSASNYLKIGMYAADDLLTINGYGDASLKSSLYIGYRRTTSTPTNANLITLVPPYHTGGPWYLNGYDDSSCAYFRLLYGSSEVGWMRHDGVAMLKTLRLTSGYGSSFPSAVGAGHIFFKYS